MRRAHDHSLLSKSPWPQAAAAWDYVDGMMQFERRFEDRTEQNSLECVDYALRYAPLLFDGETLNTLSILLQTQKRIDKNTTADLAGDLANATQLMKDAHRLWNHLERHVQVQQDQLRGTLGGEQDRWCWIAEKWESMGFVQRVPNRGSYLISLATSMETVVRQSAPRVVSSPKRRKVGFGSKSIVQSVEPLSIL